jgi:hypothetical protein
MKNKKQEITAEDILAHWRQGKSTLDWRGMTIKGKMEWLQACLHWSRLPEQPIPAFDYIIDGNQVTSHQDYFCLLGEVFFGYRGYFGSNLDGWYDCFSEIYIHDKHKPTVEKGAKVIIKNASQVAEAMAEDSLLPDNYFLEIVKGFKKFGFEVKLE